MLRISFLLLSFQLVINLSCQSLHTLSIEVSNIQNTETRIFLGLYDTEASFKTKSMAIDSVVFIPKTNVSDIFINNIPDGEYAIAIFQDINNNGKLDMGILKIPKEPIGISNFGEKNKVGIPTFNKAKIKINGDTTISIPLIFKKVNQ